MRNEWAFNKERPGTDPSSNGGTQTGSASITTVIEDLYENLLQFDLTYEQMYQMTVKELYDTLMARRKGLAYKIWRGANMIARAVWDSQRYPSTPKDAMPELFPRVSIKMPDFLQDEWIKKMGGS